MELPAADLFLKLRRGEIKAQGKLLPPGVTVIDFVEEDNSYGRSDFADLPIPLYRLTFGRWQESIG